MLATGLDLRQGISGTVTARCTKAHEQHSNYFSFTSKALLCPKVAVAAVLLQDCCGRADGSGTAASPQAVATAAGTTSTPMLSDHLAIMRGRC